MAIFDLNPPSINGINPPAFPKPAVWLNSEPLTTQDLKGKVVLVDFWTYSCINCQRTLPYLRSWWEKYKNQGLIIIGVHTPEFDFEKDINNVKNALSEYQVTWPVVLDNDYQIWDSYSNHFWPAKYLINAKSKIIYTHFGEGNYLETEIKIQKALEEAGFKPKEQITGQLSNETIQLGQTPETYCGFLRGVLGNSSGFVENKDFNYTLPQDQPLAENMLYLTGHWKSEAQYLEHSRQTQELEDILTLSYRASKVYLVMESAAKSPIKVYVTLDGVALIEDTAGDDIKFDEEGRAYTQVQFSTLYNLIKTKTFGDHILRISSLEQGLRIYAFTFGS